MLKQSKLIILLLLPATVFFLLPGSAAAECPPGATINGNYKSIGPIEISPPDRYVYAIIDGSLNPQQFVEIKAKLRSAIPGKSLGSGTLTATVRYIKIIDYAPDLSNGPPEYLEDDFTFSVSAPIAIPSLGYQNPVEFTFDFSADPIPAGIVDLYLYIKFEGMLDGSNLTIPLQSELDLNEPMHIAVINSTDRFYLDGQLRTGEEIRNDPDLFARVDFDGDGTLEWWLEGQDREPYIDPFNVSVGLGFSESSQQAWTPFYNPLQPGNYGRIIIVTGTPQFWMFLHSVASEPAELIETPYHLAGVVDHWIVDPDTGEREFENSAVYGIRGVGLHQYFVRMIYFPDYMGIFEAPWPGLTPVPITP